MCGTGRALCLVRRHYKTKRLGCPCLIQLFLSQDAQFLYVGAARHEHNHPLNATLPKRCVSVEESADSESQQAKQDEDEDEEDELRSEDDDQRGRGDADADADSEERLAVGGATALQLQPHACFASFADLEAAVHEYQAVRRVRLFIADCKTLASQGNYLQSRGAKAPEGAASRALCSRVYEAPPALKYFYVVYACSHGTTKRNSRAPAESGRRRYILQICIRGSFEK